MKDRALRDKQQADPQSLCGRNSAKSKQKNIAVRLPHLYLLLMSIFLAGCFSAGPTGKSATPIHQQHNTPGSNGSPYGFTVYEQFQPATVNDLQKMHISWIRYQLNWSSIEPQSGVYDWSQLDAAVALANKNHIHMTFPLQTAPQWALSQVCAGQHFLPGPTEMAAFASEVAHRYNNQDGHGYIDSFEVGNEEFDSLWTGNWDVSTACRQPTFYGPVLAATYKALKAASPHALVGMNSMWWVNSSHVHDYMTWLYQNHYGNDFDFANFHYYICNGDPALPSGERPSLADEASIVHQVMQQYGDGSKPIWLTELGWNVNSVDQAANCQVTPQQQANYLTEATTIAMNSGSIRHIFWYTINRGNDGMSITQPGGNLPSFAALQNFVQRYPIWP